MELKDLKLTALALIAFSLTACSADEELNEIAPETNNAISFSVQTPNMTRAADSYNCNSRPNRFKVTAYQGADNYYGGAIDEMSSPDGGFSWTSSHKRFWPSAKSAAQNSLTFYAFIEHNDMDACATEGYPHSFDMSGDVPMFRNFKVNGDVTKQNDLMYSVAKDVSQNSTRQGDVTLNFRHALSQICFTAQNNHPGLEDIEIISIEVGGIKGTGTYRFPKTTTSTLPAASSAKNANGIGEWILDSNAGSKSYLLVNLSESLGAPDASGHGKVKNISNPEFTGTREEDTGDISRAMYLIPQKVQACSSESANDGAYIKATVRMTPKNAKEQSQPTTVFVPISIDWKEGQRYVYNLTWEGTPISYNVSIADYSEVTY